MLLTPFGTVSLRVPRLRGRSDEAKLMTWPRHARSTPEFDRLRARLAAWTSYPAMIGGWVQDYNTARPHSSLGYLTPAAFAATLHPQRASTLRHLKGSAPTPVAHGHGARNSHHAIPVAAG